MKSYKKRKKLQENQGKGQRFHITSANFWLINLILSLHQIDIFFYIHYNIIAIVSIAVRVDFADSFSIARKCRSESKQI